MLNVVLVIHLILALALILIVLLQRSEGGGLGIGGGGGNGAMTGRAAATALGKVTWGLAIAFICTSLALTILQASSTARSSVTDTAPAGVTETDSLLPPPADESEPVLPSAN